MVNKIFNVLLSEKTRKQIEIVILSIAVVSFVVHLIAIALGHYNIIEVQENSELLKNPISAIYTPFSFILVYEVYLLIFFLPRSITTYITKQYEIITLIIIRNLFKDLSNLELSSDWFAIKNDLQFTYDIVASLILFYLIYLFQKQGKLKLLIQQNSPNVERFIKIKKSIAVILIPLFLSLSLFSFSDWALDLFTAQQDVSSIKSINAIFFDQFFTVLILVDVLLLLFSFYYTDKFNKIIRNSGFIVSTILIRMSFGVKGLISTILVLVAVLFGLAIISIHNKFEKNNID
jgi:hypothetical protein